MTYAGNNEDKNFKHTVLGTFHWVVSMKLYENQPIY